MEKVDYDARLHAEDSRCVQRGLRTRATCTDHIRSLRDGGTHLDPANSQSLCTSCNLTKAKRHSSETQGA